MLGENHYKGDPKNGYQPMGHLKDKDKKEIKINPPKGGTIQQNK